MMDVLQAGFAIRFVGGQTLFKFVDVDQTLGAIRFAGGQALLELIDVGQTSGGFSGAGFVGGQALLEFINVLEPLVARFLGYIPPLRQMMALLPQRGREPFGLHQPRPQFDRGLGGGGAFATETAELASGQDM
jgi:hypothetical protein